MKPIFVDTAALIAIGNKRDTFHSKALELRYSLKNSGRKFVTTSAVLLEFGNAFSPKRLKPTGIKMIEAVIHSEKWKCIELTNELMTNGFDLYKSMNDKDWGLVDCTSIIVAHNMGISEIFTTDHHFEQAGFSILLKESY